MTQHWMTAGSSTGGRHPVVSGSVAQLDRAPDFGSGGCGFESYRGHMEMRIKNIYSREMFPGLIMEKPKEGQMEMERARMLDIVKPFHPVLDISQQKWTVLHDSDGKSLGYGTWGNLLCAQINIFEDGMNHTFWVMTNHVTETQRAEDVIQDAVSRVNWKDESYKWDPGDL